MMNKSKLEEKIFKMIEAAGETKPGVKHIMVLHDDGCPAIKTESLLDCRCNPDFKKMKPDA
jgi:hypothetical protein